MATPLFRTIQTDAQRLTGLVDPRAPGWAALTAFLLLSTAAAAGFVATAPYARRQTAIGLVAPQAGTVRVSAPRPGIMAEIFVADGALVAAGDALFSVDYRRALQAGDTLEASTQRALERQEALLLEQIASEASRHANSAAELDSRIAGLAAERRGLLDQHALLQRRMRVAAERFDGVADLRRRGLITETDFRAREDAWLARQQELSAAEQRIDAIDHAERQARLQAAQLPADSQDRVARLRGTLAGLQQQKAAAAAEGGEIIRAPVAGRVTALQVATGQQAGPTRPVLALVPQDVAMRAELFVPSRAIGFVQLGQPVRLMYDAFPFQRFGAQGGTVDNISATMLTPDEVTGPLRPDGPVYRVSVRLERSGIQVGGREIALQPDMTLRADIVLERRAVLQWLLEPVMGMRERLRS